MRARHLNRRSPGACLRGSRAAVVMAVVVLTLAASLQPGHASQDAVSRPVRARLGRRELSLAIKRLAAAHIPVYASADATRPLRRPARPASGLHLLEWEVRNLVLNGRNEGLSGEEIDAAIGIEPGSPSAAALVLAWARGVHTPAARWARTLMRRSASTDDVGAVVYPELVLILFTADVANMATRLPPVEGEPPPVTGSTAGSAFAGGPGRAVHTRVAGAAVPVCSSLVNFVNDTINWVFAQLGRVTAPELPTTKSSILGFFRGLAQGALHIGAAFVNSLIDAAHFVLVNGVKLLIQPVMAFIARIAAVVGTVTYVVNLLKPWTVRFASDPIANRKAVGDEAPIPGTVEVRIEVDGPDKWPEEIQDCATQSGVPLPPLRPIGNHVDWRVDDGDVLETPGVSDPVLDDQSRGLLRYATTVEPAEYAKGTTQAGEFSVHATVVRDDADKLSTAVEQLIMNAIDGTIARFIAPIVQPWAHAQLTTVLAKLTDFRNPRGVERVPVSYHTPPERKKPARRRRNTGPWVLIAYPSGASPDAGIPPTLVASTCDGPNGHWTGIVQPAQGADADRSLAFDLSTSDTATTHAHVGPIAYTNPSGDPASIEYQYDQITFTLVTTSTGDPAVSISGTETQTVTIQRVGPVSNTGPLYDIGEPLPGRAPSPIALLRGTLDDATYRPLQDTKPQSGPSVKATKGSASETPTGTTTPTVRRPSGHCP